MRLYHLSSFLCWIRTTAKSATLTSLFPEAPPSPPLPCQFLFLSSSSFAFFIPWCNKPALYSLPPSIIGFQTSGCNSFSKHKDDIKSDLPILYALLGPRNGSHPSLVLPHLWLYPLPTLYLLCQVLHCLLCHHGSLVLRWPPSAISEDKGKIAGDVLRKMGKWDLHVLRCPSHLWGCHAGSKLEALYFPE